MVAESADRVILAAVAAAGADKRWMTCDRIEAMAGGHGTLALAVWAIADTVAEEVLQGADLRLRFANTARLPVEDLLRKCVEVARRHGADGANAALLSAAVLYLAGSNVQAGVPAGNRKLGALARLIAGVDRSGVVAIPTRKMGNKVSGFPAVQAIYRAMAEGRLVDAKGASPTGRRPEGAAGPLFGHSALGEDLIIPQMARNGARLATQAMLDAMDGAFMSPAPWDAAIIGAAAILEIVHPDADVSVPDGGQGRVNSAYLAGLGATEAARLPRELHMRVTGEVYDTARLVGDLGLILKDVGAPTVVGMIALGEVLASFVENAADPISPPLAHVCSDAVVAMRGLLAGKDEDEVAEAIVAEKRATALDPEMALVGLNTMARKADESCNGPVARLLMHATEPTKVWALQRRAAKAYADLTAGRTLAEVVHDLEMERKTRVELACGEIFSRKTGKQVDVAITKVARGQRHPGGRGHGHWALDPDVDVTVTMDGQTARLEGLGHKAIPQVFLGEAPELAWALPIAAVPVVELSLSAHTIVNITVPAAVAAVLGKLTPAEAAAEAEKAAFITAGIPGARQRAAEVAKLAVRIARG